jgi:hypothetical protein
MNNVRCALVLSGALALGACSSNTNATGTSVASGTAGAMGRDADGEPGTTSGGAGTTAGSSGTGGAAGSASSADASGGGAGGVGGSRAGEDAGSGRDGSVPESGAADAAFVDGKAGTWPRVDDYGAPGPLMVRHETNTGPNAVYDVFRPATLGTDARRHPIVSWANGTLFGISDYQGLLTHWASHGFVVIAAQSKSTAGGGTHKAGIDWLVAENGRSASAYFGMLDAKAIGAAGHSQGGGATIAAGADKPGPSGIVTTLPLMAILSFETDKTIVSRQAVPMFDVSATMDDRDPTGAIANQIYDGANRELVQAAFIGIHEDAMTVPMYAPTLAWFRWRLMGDESARAFFYPTGTCSLCRDPAWKQVRYKNTP